LRIINSPDFWLSDKRLLSKKEEVHVSLWITITKAIVFSNNTCRDRSFQTNLAFELVFPVDRFLEDFSPGFREVTSVILKYGSALMAKRAMEYSISWVCSLIFSEPAIAFSSSSRDGLFDFQAPSLRVSAVNICHSILTEINIPPIENHRINQKKT